MTALMYHDIVAAGGEDTSGFTGRDAARYKVTPRLFGAHLDAIVATAGTEASRLAITFDDGGNSAMTAADALERRGLRGRFFVTVNYIGTPGFLSRSDLAELSRRGHTIGSHSCSHPLRMGHCKWSQLIHEWSRSRTMLSDLLSDNVLTGSLPGGDFAPRVAEAAAQAGYVTLFTSEPHRAPRDAHGLTLVGRFTIRPWTTARTASALAAGRFVPCARQALLWNARKLSKRVGGNGYLLLRRALLRQGNGVQWGDTIG